MVGFGGGLAAGAAVTIVIQAVDKATGVLNNVNKSMLATGAAITGLSVVGAKALGGLAKEAGEATGVMNAFNNMFGDGSKKALEGLRKATRGTVSDIELMTQANQALLLGIDPEALPAMFEGALSAAKATGRPVSSAIADITTGIGRQSRLILDNLGIIVKSEEANIAYANSLGKTASELTDTEKKAAFMNATMKALQLNQEKIGEVQDDVSIKAQRMAASFANVKLTIGTALIPVLEALASILQPIIGFFEQHPTVAKWVGIGTAVAIALGLIVGPILMLIAILPALITGFGLLSTVTLPITGTILAIAAAIAAVIAIGVLLVKNWGKVKLAALDVADGFNKAFTAIGNVVLKIWNSIVNTIENNINLIIKSINTLIRGINKIPGIDISQIQKVDLSKFQADMIKYEPIDRGEPKNQMSISIENIFGVDPEGISQALSDELGNKVSL